MMRLRTRLILVPVIGLVSTVAVAWAVVPFTNLFHEDYYNRQDGSWRVPLGRVLSFRTQTPDAPWAPPR